MIIQQQVSPWISRWLGLVALMIAAMVVVGGATRLTGSGLSITEWAPILGTIPPLSDADWQVAFAKYQHSSQYILQNSAMTIADFHSIFWWEWSHRFLGRMIGFVVFLPLIYFAWRKMLPAGLWPRIVILLILGAAQGALGWFMVASGLEDRVSVTQYRLAAHLTVAMILFAYVVWLRFTLAQRFKPYWGLGALTVALVLLQIAAGGFVAGLNAGQGYNTWPLMDGAFIPHGLVAIQPWWLNSFENVIAVQFNHRILAYVIFGLALWQAFTLKGRAQILLLSAIMGQIALGITTLLLHVPMLVALIHQAGALVVLTAAVWNFKAA
ncbi:MAG: COX15/CtaA family protein, partial [Pseudomonadota bacterium]|nr:COX15/CtaA family protein [Pseudomonadota bacterium]